MASLDCDDFVESVPCDDWERETGGCGGVLSHRTGLFRHFFRGRSCHEFVISMKSVRKRFVLFEVNNGL